MNPNYQDPPNLPPLAQRDRRAFYFWLVQNGYPRQVAFQETEKKFGTIKTPEEQAQEAQKKKSGNQLAQVGGMVGGTVGGALLAKGVQSGYDALTTPSTTPPTTTTSPVAQPVQATPVQSAPVQSAPTQAAPTGGMSSAADVGISNMMSGNNVIPQGAPVPQGYTAVGSHPNGTIVAPTSVAGDVPADPSFLASVNWNVVLPAGVAALQAYNAYNAYKKGDKVGATLQGAGALASGAAAASAAGIGGATTATIGAAAAPIAGIAGAYQGYQTAKYTSDAPAGGQRDRNTTLGMASAGAGIGATIGSIVPGAGTAAGAVVGAAVGALAGLASSKFGSSKGKQQMLRDAARKSLQSAGLLDQNYQGTLADGSSYDFGKDGKKYGKLNTENPNWGLAAGFANVIGAGEGLYGRSLESVATMYANAAMSNSGGNQDIVLANMRHFAQQRGFNLENVSAQINKMFDDNLINENQKAAYLNGAQQIFGAQQPDQTAIVPRPRKGEVARVSAGLYRNDRGQLVPGKTMKEALQRAYESPSKSKRK